MFEMDKKLRVLYILGELKLSGAECMLKVVVKEFSSLGIANEILSTGSEQIGSYAPMMREVGYAIHHIPFSKTFRFFFRVYGLMRARRYDVVHIHSERANFWFGLTAAAARVPRVISTVHGTFAFQGWLRVRRMIFRRLQDNLGVVRVAIGPSVQETEWKHFGSLTKIIPNWFDNKRFSPPTTQQRIAARRAFFLDEKMFVIVSVGNCSKIKNHAAFIQALASVPKELPVVYLHVGAEERGYPERHLAANLGVGDKVRFLGQLEDPLEALYAADAYVMPSLSEGTSIAALEAFAVGLPAILSDVSGLRDFGNQFPGILYAKPTPSSLMESVIELTRLDSFRRNQIASDYPRITRERFGMDTGVSQYARLYRSNSTTTDQLS